MNHPLIIPVVVGFGILVIMLLLRNKNR